jgi:feruloyl-CoA synthase
MGPTDLVVERRDDGSLVLRSPHELGPWPDRITDWLLHWAKATPERVFLAERDEGGEWRTVTYARALRTARSIGQALLDRGLSPQRPVAVISGNDVEHALVQLGALIVGVPYAPVSPAYSLASKDHRRLREALGLLTPGLVFAADGTAFATAIEAAVPGGTELVLSRGSVPGRRATPFATLAATAPTAAVEEARTRVGPDTIAKFLFTSGSTGRPKAVVNTQRMWCSNQEMLRTMLAFVRDEPPVVVGWAPWHHTAAGNHDFGLVLANGGSYYIDEGRPVPGAIEATVRNLRDVGPTFYFNVPRGFEVLLPFLRRDETLRRTFFSRLKLLFFAGAGLSQHVFDEMRELAIATLGEAVVFGTGLGSTETAPFTLGRTWDTDDAANMGVPPPGAELKLVPFQDRFELRVKGPHVTPGYWRQPELTARAFDEEGFYRLGDTFVLADEEEPSRGLCFRGRLADDFKLGTGTWVRVGPLRSRFLTHFFPFFKDVVIAGAGRDVPAALAFPDPAGWASLGTSAERRARLAALLASFDQDATGSSTRIDRILVVEEAPSLDAGEVTDKGTLNPRAVLEHRAALVETLYVEPPAPEVIHAAGTHPSAEVHR